MPLALVDFARDAMAAALRDPQALPRALGEYLTEPKANVWFEGGDHNAQGGVRLDRRTRMLFDVKHIFINGESFTASGRDARIMRALANQHQLSAAETKLLSDAARDLLGDWVLSGWVHADD
jgi:50S ribosomal protein L16 3-hydroxylase